MSGHPSIPQSAVPNAASSICQHILDAYASEINKVGFVWSQFSDGDLAYRPHPRSSTVADILKHELLSGRRFFAEFLGAPEPPPGDVLPPQLEVEAYVEKLLTLAIPRLAFLGSRPEDWWLEPVPFFDVTRERIWIFWRRVLHTAHHRTQLTVYLRLLDKPVPSVYGPTADVTWKDADPTNTTEAAGRK